MNKNNKKNSSDSEKSEKEINDTNDSKEIIDKEPSYQLNSLNLEENIDNTDFFCEFTFKHLPEDFPIEKLSKPTLQGLKDMKLKQMSRIQFQSLPQLLRGRDLLAAARTGSGKTLAFLIPIFEVLQQCKFKQDSGIGAIVIAPTRELVGQIEGVARQLGKHHSFNIASFVGGTGKKSEITKIKNGANLVIGTPGRLMDHLRNGKDQMQLKNFKMLVLDEADLTLQQGFEVEVNEILKLVPSARQTALFSATQTKKIEELSRVSLHKPQCIGIDMEYQLNDEDAEDEPISEDKIKTVKGLEQGFIQVKFKNRFKFLYSFLRKNSIQKKIMVFVNSCAAAQYFSNLLNFLNVDNQVLHGKLKQAKRTQVLAAFRRHDQAVLLCTDVASRGLDIPDVDCVLQLDAPLSLDKQVHRAGRTARGHNGTGRSLVCLQEKETGFLASLATIGLEEVKEFIVPETKMQDVDPTVQGLVAKNYELNMEAKDAFKQSLQSQSNHANKAAFSVMNVDIKQFALGQGLEVPPYIDLNSLCLKDPKSKSLRLKRKIKLTEIEGRYNPKKYRREI